MFSFRNVCAAAVAIVLSLMPFSVGIGAQDGRIPAVAKTPLPAALDVTTSDLPHAQTVAVEIRRGSIAPGGTTIWHTHPAPSFVYVQSGSGKWEFKGGRPPETRSAGQAIEELPNVVTRIVAGKKSALYLVIFQVSKPGDPVLVPAKSL